MPITTRPAALTFAELMRKFEDFVATPYDDGKHIGTIGIGTNIEDVKAYLALVLKALRVFEASDRAVTTLENSAQRNARYQAIVDDFANVIDAAPLNRQPDERPGTSDSGRANSCCRRCKEWRAKQEWSDEVRSDQEICHV